MAQSYLRNPSIERLPNILEELHTGSLCIPPFQRDFEWTGEQRLALCESVAMGLPTGSLMVWRTSRQLAAENPVGPYRVPTKHPPSGVQYLLDGRQRITTLYAALAQSFWTRGGMLPSPPDEEYATAPDDTPWEIFYNLDRETFVFQAAQQPQQLISSEDKKLLLPLAVLLDDLAYDRWRETTTPTREQSNRARAVRSAFMDYQIPIVPLAVDDIHVVTLTFKRVNNGGTPMSDADMARALAWSEGFDLRVHLSTARELLKPSGWGSTEDDLLLKVVAAVCGIDPTEVDPENLARKIKETPNVVDRASELVLHAALLLRRRIGISGPASLPYAQMLLFTARAFHEANEELSTAQQDLLAAWLAEVCLDERFGGAPPHVVRAEWGTFARRLGLPNAGPPVSGRDERKPVARECWKFGLGWARSLGTGLVLASHCPRLGDGVPIADPYKLVATGSEDVGVLLAVNASGIPASLNSWLKAYKGAGLRSPANRVVCPQANLPALRETIFGLTCAREILDSHLINTDAHTALTNGDLPSFFELRRVTILEAEQRWVEERGGKVELQRDHRPY